MIIGTRMKAWRSGLMLVLLCLCSMPQLAGAGTAPPIPTGPLDAQGNPATPDYYTTANWANSPPLAKFVDTLPGLGAAKANNLGQYLSVAKPDVTSYPGSDYYEIDLVEYRERLHSDLPAPGTLLRGYVQVNRGSNLSPGTLPSQNRCGADQHPCSAADTLPGTGLVPDPVHHLGPTIIAERDRPVRIKFTNRLPVGPAGNLFIPVDTSVMGAGSGPAFQGGARGEGAPCDNTVEPNSCASYTQNRAVIHLHGGRTPWISDGTPHQWITPAEEITPFTRGVSLQNVPDMPDPGDGSVTYYYTNQQSARLMFYHDHAFGITRLNVYAGEAAGYVITDQWEQDLVTRGLIPPDQIPLIIQDKTFVDATPTPHPVSGEVTPKVRITDPLWNWGSGPLVDGVRTPVTGDLWLPHVYMPAQTLAAGFGGVNPFGRWMYGPWFYPATAVTKGPVANPYYDEDCSSPIPAVYANCTTPGQPTMIPGTPNTSMGMEAFQDSAVVNGTVFPSLTVDPRAYRFRILNAASDRFWNLSFYEADPAQLSPDARLSASGRSNRTEVKMLPASADLAAAQGWPELWPVDGRDGGVPDPALRGPSFLQIGTEGGFLPQPVQIDPQPIVYYTDPTAFWVGTVDKMGLALGPAERADVIVDFSQFAGKTLILYNDAPAAWPARVPGYDYFTGAPDQRESGGYGTGGVFNQILGVWEGGSGPLVGYAPNTRTVMQVIVRPTTGTDPAYSFNRANLEREFTAQAPVTAINPAPAKTLFERAQEPIIVGQTAYSATYPNSYFPPNYPWEGISQINDQTLNFVTLAGDLVVALQEPKGIHDEMGASFDPVYGRMSGNLAMQLPNPTTLNALLILYGFSDLPTEVVQNSTQLEVSVIPGTSNLADGTQIWKISHNGVDTHPIHFHIFDVQLINRVGWDGQILFPEPNELGWKDTVKISPLMDTIVAVRPRAPALPFGITNSLRPLNPAIPLDSGMGFNSVDWQTGEARAVPVTNILYDFGWEYVWHCHILSHEEMDMMRPVVLNVLTTAPNNPALESASYANSRITLNWSDPTPAESGTTPGNQRNEVGFKIERCEGAACTDFAPLATALANATSYQDFAISPSTSYRYRMYAFNASGNSGLSVTRSATTGASLPATIAITAPATGSTFLDSEAITINATASVANGVTVTNVQFFDGATLLATDSTAPYSFTWNGASVGAHTLNATVTPSSGAPVTASVQVTVLSTQAAAPASITVPASSATGSFTVSWAASATAGVSYTLEESTSAGFGTSTVVSSGSSATSAAIAGKVNGTYYYRVKAVRAGYVDSPWVSGQVVVTIAPPTGSIVINGGAAFTASPTITVTLSASSAITVSQMHFSKDGGATWSNWEPYATTRTMTMAAGDGVKTVSVQFRDTAGNVSPAYSDSITLSTAAPTGSIVINGGAAFTASPTVTVTLSASSALTVDQMRFSKDDGLTWSNWEPYATTRTMTVAAGDGVKTVSVQFRDTAGNVSVAYSDSITLSTAAPTGSIVINGGAALSASATVTVTLSATSPSGVSQMRFSKDGGVTWSNWENYATTRVMTLSAGDGLKTVSVLFRNASGAVSPVYSDSITVDRTQPTGSIVINGGAVSTNSVSVTLTLTGADANGVASMQFSKDNVTWYGWEAFSVTRVASLLPGAGTKSMYVRFKDLAGNVSLVYSDTIEYAP